MIWNPSLEDVGHPQLRFLLQHWRDLAGERLYLEVASGVTVLILTGRYLEARAKTGDKLLLHGPFGGFYLRAPRRPILFLAGGTGIGPILSMLEYLAAYGANDQPVRLVYGARDDADLVEVERIEALRARTPKFAYATTCSGPASRHPLTGRVTNHFGAGALNNGDADVYLCGPPEMVESGRRHVAKLGLSPANIHFEKFVPASDALAV